MTREVNFILIIVLNKSSYILNIENNGRIGIEGSSHSLRTPTELPKQEDWNAWMELYLRYIGPKAPPLFLVIPILMTLYRWHTGGQERPPSRAEINENISGRFSHFWGGVVPTKAMPTSSENLIYKKLVSDGHLKSQSMSEWEKSRDKVTPSRSQVPLFDPSGGLSTAIFMNKSEHGRTMLYSLTGSGVIYLEFLLSSPWLAMSLLPKYIERGYLTFSSVSWSILLNADRHKIRRVDQRPISGYTERARQSLFVQQSKILGSFEDVFWRMSDASTRLLWEYASLKHHERKATEALLQARRFSKNEESMRRAMEIKESPAQPLLSIGAYVEEHLMVVRAMLKDVIIPKGKQIGLTEEMLQEYGPKQNPL